MNKRSLIACTLTLLAGCQRSEYIANQTPLPSPQRFTISAASYSGDHYFLDTAYCRLYEPYYKSNPPIVNSGMQVVYEEVWIARPGIPDPHAISGVACISLPPRGTGYPDSLYSEEIEGQVQFGRFTRLNRSEYILRGDGFVGIITLKTPVQDGVTIAIAYRRAHGDQFGVFSDEALTDTIRPQILKMVRPRNLEFRGNTYSVAWHQLVKSIYPIGFTSIDRRGFYLDVFYLAENGEHRTDVVGGRLLNILGLDNYTPNGTPLLEGDGLFDFRPGVTIDRERGEVIFPYVEPFNEGIIAFFTERGFPIETIEPYTFPELYDTTRVVAENSPHNRYSILGEHVR